MYVALLTLDVVLYALIIAFYLRTNVATLFHPLTIYLAFHGIVFVLRPVLSWYYNYQMIYRLYQFTPDFYAKAMALVVANVGLFCFAAASLRWGNAPLRSRADRFTALELRTMTPSLLVTTLILVPVISWSVNASWVLRDNASATLLMDPSTGTTINTTGNGYLQAAFGMGVALMPLLAWAGGFRWWSVIPAFVFAVALAGTGLRGPIVSELLCLCALYLYSRRRKWLELRTIVILGGAMLAFGTVGSDRGAAVRSFLTGSQIASVGSSDRGAPLEGMDLANLEFVEFLVDKIPRASGTYEYFVDNLQVITEPIPRVLWKNKPIGQPIRFFYLFDYGFPIGMTRSLPGEGWTQLGLAGVAIWCGLWGAICGWIYNRYALSRQSVLQTAAYMTFLAMLIVFYRDGVLVTMLRQGMFFLAPIGLWAILAWLFGSVSAHDLRRVAAARFAQRGHASDKVLAGPGTGAVDAVPRLLPRSRRHTHR